MLEICDWLNATKFAPGHDPRIVRFLSAEVGALFQGLGELFGGDFDELFGLKDAQLLSLCVFKNIRAAWRLFCLFLFGSFWEG